MIKTLEDAKSEGVLVNNIYNADCLEVMRLMKDKSVDLVVTDPPYGIKITKKSKKYGTSTQTSRIATNEPWDDFAPNKEYFKEIFRVSRNQIVFGANYFWENFYSSGCYIVWDKRGNLPDVPFAPTEFAWTSFKKRQSKKYTCINHGFVKQSKDVKWLHPTQKPTEVMQNIISDFSKDEEIILDPFLGSGTTARACKNLNRNFIGIEISPKYCEISRQRLRQEILL